MAVTVKEITLWRREIENRPGMLAQVLEPLAGSAADLQVLMAYRYPGDETRGAVELFPISGKKATAAAQAAGLARADSAMDLSKVDLAKGYDYNALIHASPSGANAFDPRYGARTVKRWLELRLTSPRTKNLLLSMARVN